MKTKITLETDGIIFINIVNADGNEENKKEPVTETVDIIAKSYPLCEFVSKLERDGIITVPDGESVWETALRCWKDDRDKLYGEKKVDTDTVQMWNLRSSWEREDIGNCRRCSKRKNLSGNGVCLECFDFLWDKEKAPIRASFK
jgi:hypothetical protein